MNLKRLIRDGGILLLFCGAFYLTTYVGGDVTDEAAAESVESSDYTSTRIAADEMTRLGKWEEAADEFKQLIEHDPYNGYAQFRLGASYYNARLAAVRKLREPESLSQEEIEQNQELRATFEELAINQLEKSREFLRYRRDSSFCLAVIYADQNQLEKSLARLKEFVDEGGWRYEGLENIEVFGRGGEKMQSPWSWKLKAVRLHQFPEFWLLARKANETRNRMAAPTPIRPSFGNRH